jgi:glycosyl transferase family 87/WD40 repeat protein
MSLRSHESAPHSPSAAGDGRGDGSTALRLPFGRSAETLLLVLLVGIFLWRGFLPGWRSLNTDFPNYYLAARLYRQGYSLDRVYDWIWFQRQKDHAGIEPRIVEFIPSTPYAAVAVLPLAKLPPLQAKRLWLVVNLLLLGLTGYLLSRMTALGARRIAILTFLAVIPLRTDFLFGQQHVLVLFLLTLAAWLYFEGRPASCGAALALGAALRIYPAVFIFYFLRKKQWRAIAGLVLACFGLGLLSIWLFGFATIRTYVVEVLPRAFKGEDIDPYDVHWNSFTALLRRLFTAEPEMNPHPLAHLPAVYAVAQPLVEALLFVPFLWLMSASRSQPAREKLEWGGYVALLLAMSTHPASYHFCALILTAALAADSLLRSERKKQALALVILYTLVSLPLERFTPGAPSGWHTVMAFPRLYALTALWLLLLWALAKSSGDPSVWRAKWRQTAVFAGIFVALAGAGAWTNLRHLEGQFANYASRLVIMPQSLMTAEPAAARETVAFTMMSPDWKGYITARLFGDSPTYVNLGADTFHPTLASGPDKGWVELAGTRSRIVQLPANGSSQTAEQLPSEIDDAEQPTVSADGQWLAFIRETEGRGSLWVKDLRPPVTGGAPSRAERQVVDFTWNVLDAAFFPDHRIAFVAQPDGRPGLFVVDVETRRVIPLAPEQVRARYPAISPDGEWLAYSREESGNWQLHVVRLSDVAEIATRDDRRLTSADCNSISPAWLPDSKTVVYATDCGRGLGLTALCKIRVAP